MELSTLFSDYRCFSGLGSTECLAKYYSSIISFTSKHCVTKKKKKSGKIGLNGIMFPLPGVKCALIRFKRDISVEPVQSAGKLI